MADTRALPLQEGVLVQLDKPRRIRLDLLAMYEAERDLEVRLGQPAGSCDLLRSFFLNQLTTTQLLVLLTAGLRWEDPTLTFEQVGRMVNLRQVGAIIDQVINAWNEAMPEAPPEPGRAEETTASPPSSNGADFGHVPAMISN